MNNRQGIKSWMGRGGRWAGALCLAAALLAAAAQTPPQPADSAATGEQAGAAATHITPEQARQLFALVDELMKFSSDDSGLPIKSTVKRQMTTRAAVEAYLKEKFNEDEGARRLQRDEIVLKKFGMLDRDFELKPFLLALLKEQIEAYYDAKTKTINLLDWVDTEQQKPVMAHELTHALQDQHIDLNKWDDQTPDDVSTDAAGDQDHLARDEMDTARDAVAEGQATAVMLDYFLKPLGKSLVNDPEVLDVMRDKMTGTDSPVMARAPLLLSESMLFPYREGLSFEQDVWMDQGQSAAFAGALDHPPTSSWEILNPREYERRHTPAIPLLPNIHPLVDKLYRPYDIGQIGQLDVHILAELFGGERAARDLTPAWNGGIYWAGQLRSARTAAAQASTGSLAIFYLSVWKSPNSAQQFAKLYGNNLARKYQRVKPDASALASAPTTGGEVEAVYSTDEGPVAITTRGNMVFVAESFPLELARRLSGLILDAQGRGALRIAAAPRPASAPKNTQTLTAGLVHLLGHCGAMKAAVDAAAQAAQ